MNERLFMGTLQEEMGMRQLKENYLEGSSSWFGEIKEGDFLIPSENSAVSKLLQVDSIEVKEKDRTRYHFKVIKEYIPSIKSSLVYGSKYFKLDIVTFTNAYKPASSRSHFYQLQVEEKYNTQGIENFEFNEENARNIYVTEDVEKIEDKHEGDIFFVVLNKEGDYQIREVLEYKGEKSFNKINLKEDIANTINIEQYGLRNACLIEKKNKYTKKKNLLEKIINTLENHKTYKHPFNSNLGEFYNVLIVNTKTRKKVKDSENEKEEQEEVNQETNEATIDEINPTEYCFMSREEIEKIKRLVEFNKNVILEGVPGVGKTHIARIVANELVQGKEENIKMVQFHQSYSYEDFIEGLRISEDGSGKFVPYPGILKRLCEKIKDEDRYDEKFVVIIDEINRGNISKIFGEAFMLIEKDKRDEVEIELPYSQEPFTIPENIYFIGTMNTMDKSISYLDFALNRRFKKYEIQPCFDDEHSEIKEEIKKYLDEVNSEKLNILWQKIQKINNSKEFDNIKIGHSYFCGLNKYTKEKLDEIMDFTLEYQLLPQLREYFIGNTEKIKKLEEYLSFNNTQINQIEEDE